MDSSLVIIAKSIVDCILVFVSVGRGGAPTHDAWTPLSFHFIQRQLTRSFVPSRVYDVGSRGLSGECEEHVLCGLLDVDPPPT